MSKQREHGITWTEQTWNPIRGCTRVSQGCVNCYAERVAARFSGPGQPYEGLAKMTAGGPRWTGNVELVEDHLLDPLRWKRPRLVFVNSMSDLFHESLPDEAIDRIFAVMALTPQHQFQVLTKRPARMLAWFSRRLNHIGIAALCFVGGAATRLRDNQLPYLDGERLTDKCPWLDPSGPELAWPLHNVWLGVSVEDQATADERIPVLLQTPAAVRFVSAEPLLGPVTLNRWLLSEHGRRALGARPGISWVIVGGESGAGARPMHPDWARSLRDQCRATGVAFFMKQLDGKRKSLADFPEDLRVREYPAR